MIEQTILIELRDQYGRTTARPYCERAHWFARIAGTKTLTLETLRSISALGYGFELADWDGGARQIPFEALAARLDPRA